MIGMVRPMLRRLGWLGTTVVVLALAGAVTYHFASRLGGGDEIPTMTVAEGEFKRRVTAEGTLKAVNATPVTAPPEARGGLKIEWLAEDGSYVAEGEIVVRFDASEFEKQLENSEADRVAAEAKMAKERIRAGAVRRGRDRTAEMAKAELERTREFQNKDKEIFSRNQIIESDIDEGLSTARMDHAGRARKIESRVSKSKVDLLSIEQRAAQTQLDQAKLALASLEVVAPHAGILVLKRDWRGNMPRAGETVWRGQSLGEIPLLDEMEAEVFVLEADAGGLAEGVAATMIIEAQPDVVYKAEIKRVDKLAKPRQRGVPIQYFGVILTLERTDKEVMKPGQRVRATLVFDEAKVLVVPRQAVFERDGKTVVYRQGEGDYEAVEVELGSSTPGRVIVAKGLAAGDVIALRDPTRPVDEVLSRDDDNLAKRGPSVNSK